MRQKKGGGPVRLKPKKSDVLSHEGIRPGEIPQLELYMDQVIRFMETRLDGLRTAGDERMITKTMINNYVKAGLIDKPRQKRYRPDQLMALVMVFHLKNVTSMNAIGRLFAAGGDPEKLYARFLRLQEEVRRVQEAASPAKPQTGEETVDQVIRLLLEADLCKRQAEALLGGLDGPPENAGRPDTKGKGKHDK